MPTQHIHTSFKFDELSGAAKNRARGKWREYGLHYEWWDFIYEDFGRVCAILGVELDKDEPCFSGFGSQGDGASFTGRYRFKKGALLKLMDYAPEDEKLHNVARNLQDVQRRNFYQVEAFITRHVAHHTHAYTMAIDVSRLDDACWSQKTYEDAREGVSEALRDLARWLFAALEVEYEHIMSDEHIDETLSEDDFYENGDIFRHCTA